RRSRGDHYYRDARSTFPDAQNVNHTGSTGSPGFRTTGPVKEREKSMRKVIVGAAVAMAALIGAANAADTKYTIGASIPAADHGWTGGVVFHANRVAKLLMDQHPGLNVIVKTSPDPASQANALQDLETQGINALVILPTDPDPLVNAIKEIKSKGTFVTLVD